MSVVRKIDKISVPKILRARGEGKKLTMVTAYDVTFARLLDAAGCDILLVGDSLGMVVQGNPHTLSVTLEEMIYHAKAVVRGSSRSHVMLDMPFMSYQLSAQQALENAGRAMKESGCESVKLEGGMELVETVQRLSQAGIPVMAHIGLRPQRIHQMGGYTVQGKNLDDRERLMMEAKAFEAAGAFSLLLEGIPAELAKAITHEIKIPTIGIGAGPECDGQVLVVYDLLGMDQSFRPKFVRSYANLQETIIQAVQNFCSDVREGKFPSEKESY